MKWIRKRVVWIAGTAIGGFLLWFVGTVVSLRVSQAESAGLLFGRKVPLSTYHRSLEAATHWALLTYGDRAHREIPKEELAHQAWERLMLLAEAKRLKVRVSDQEVIEEIRRHPLFTRDGQFDRSGYQAILQYSLGTTPRTFEEEVREQLTIKKLLQEVIPEPYVTDEELRNHFLRQETKQPPDEKKFDELKDSMRKELSARKRMEATLTWYQNLLKRANLKETK